MANGTSISELKKKVVDAIVKDDTLVFAIDAPECENGGDLINTHIFKFNKNPDVISDTVTFLTVLAHTKRYGRNNTYVIPTLEIWIYSHTEHMIVDPRITEDNRNDYISMLLDEKFNGSTEYGGIGKLELTTNTEGVFNNKFLYRRMIFETMDINDSVCESW